MHGFALGPRDPQTTGAPAAGGGAAASARPMSLNTPDDEDAPFVRRAQHGETEAFGVLVTRHEARVRGLVGRVLGGVEDAEDTVQEVFIQAWRALPRFRGDARFSTWLYRIATNMAIKQWHGRKRRGNTLLETEMPESARLALTDPAAGPSEEAEQRARDRALRMAVDTLSEKHRTVVLLHYFEDCPCEEIAQIVGCSVGTVWSRLHYACRKLRGQLEWMGQP